MTDLLHPATWEPQRLLEHCDQQHTRRSGPGGQHRNKVETAVVLTFRVNGVRGEASERRSQAANRRAALQRLRIKLAMAMRLPVSDQPPPSPRWRARLSGKRLVISPSHIDYPALLAEALNVIDACDYDLAAAAQVLQCSSSQLARLLQHVPAAWQLVNDQRTARGLSRWKGV